MEGNVCGRSNPVYHDFPSFLSVLFLAGRSEEAFKERISAECAVSKCPSPYHGALKEAAHTQQGNVFLVSLLFRADRHLRCSLFYRAYRGTGIIYVNHVLLRGGPFLYRSVLPAQSLVLKMQML